MIDQAPGTVTGASRPQSMVGAVASSPICSEGDWNMP